MNSKMYFTGMFVTIRYVALVKTTETFLNVYPCLMNLIIKHSNTFTRLHVVKCKSYFIEQVTERFKDFSLFCDYCISSMFSFITGREEQCCPVKLLCLTYRLLIYRLQCCHCSVFIPITLNLK